MTDRRRHAGAAPTLALLAALLAAAAAAAPPLELKVNGAWTPWRGFRPGAPAFRDPLLESAVRWNDRAPGLRVGAFEVRTEGRLWTNSVAVVELDPARLRFELAARPGWERHTADEAMQDSGVVLAVNTGLFREDGSPQGLVLLAGARRSALAGWLDVVVAIEGGALRVLDVAGARALGADASAFQTLPWLVREGSVVLGLSSGVRLSRTHRDRRITLCLGDDGLVRVLLSNFEVFGQAAGRVPVGLTIPEQATIAASAGCRDAVALDGGISAQLAVRGATRLHRMPGWRRVPLLLLARRR
ncbi:MAG: phosphodiester glycosidase family protein [Gemmatimonadota bacterium]